MKASAMFHSAQRYAALMAHATGLPNDDLYAQIIASQLDGIGALPATLGLQEADYSALLSCHFPGFEPYIQVPENYVVTRAPEYHDLLTLLLEHAPGNLPPWMAHIVAQGCMADNHLWQDLGLCSREDLSLLMSQNFPQLAKLNEHDMKWKKFLYKQLCEREGINACRAPSCEYCTDYLKCFGTED